MTWAENRCERDDSRRRRREKTGKKQNLQVSCSGLGGRAEERASWEEEDGGGDDDDDGGGGSNSDDDDDDGGKDGDSSDVFSGLIQKAKHFPPSPFHTHIKEKQGSANKFRTLV